MSKSRSSKRRSGRPRRKARAAAAKPESLQLKVGSAPGMVGIQLSRPASSINLDVTQAINLAQAIMTAAQNANAEQQAALAVNQDALAGVARMEDGGMVGPDGRPILSRPAPREPSPTE